MTKEQLIKNYYYDRGLLNTDDEIIYFTWTENELMNVLVKNYGKFVKIEDLCKEVYNEEFDKTLIRPIQVCISRTRTKIKKYFNITCRTRFGYYKLEAKNENKIS